MAFLFTDWIRVLLIFALVLSRVGGLVMTAPVFGTADVPTRIRALLAIALALLVTPLQMGVMNIAPRSLVDLTLLIAGETLIGVTIGVGITLLFSGIQVAGQVISQMSGMQLADIFNPSFNDNVPIFSQLLYLVALGVFVLIGGHHRVLEALLDTFAWLPPGGAGMPTTVSETLTTLASQSFLLGVQAAAPAMVASCSQRSCWAC